MGVSDTLSAPKTSENLAPFCESVSRGISHASALGVSGTFSAAKKSEHLAPFCGSLFRGVSQASALSGPEALAAAEMSEHLAPFRGTLIEGVSRGSLGFGGSKKIFTTYRDDDPAPPYMNAAGDIGGACGAVGTKPRSKRYDWRSIFIATTRCK